MKVTGYQLREAIKQQTLKRDSLASSFNGTLKVFPEDKKESPNDVMNDFLAAELAVTKLQLAQMRYNLAVQVNVLGERITLAEAIKRVGGPARAEKMWRSVNSPKRDSYYNRDDDEIDPNKIRAVSVITAKESLKLAQGAAKHAGAFRAAIATGNAVEVEIEDLSSELFE
jgi:hypothetical protein